MNRNPRNQLYGYRPQPATTGAKRPVPPTRPWVVLEVEGDPLPPGLPADADRWAIHGAPVPCWSQRVAEARAQDWMAQHPYDLRPFVLVGPRVCRAFRVPQPVDWLWDYANPSHRHSLWAYPSSRRWWSVRGNAEAAVELVTAVWTGELPRYEKAAKV